MSEVNVLVILEIGESRSTCSTEPINTVICVYGPEKMHDKVDTEWYTRTSHLNGHIRNNVAYVKSLKPKRKKEYWT